MDFYLWKWKSKFKIFKFCKKIFFYTSYMFWRKVYSLLGGWKSLKDFVIFNNRKELLQEKEKSDVFCRKENEAVTIFVVLDSQHRFPNFAKHSNWISHLHSSSSPLQNFLQSIKHDTDVNSKELKDSSSLYIPL